MSLEKYHPVIKPTDPHLHGGDRNFFFSPSLRRRCFYPNRLSFYRALELEFTPEVETFCEFPLQITAWLGEKHYERTADFWIRDRRGDEWFERVRYDVSYPDPEPDPVREACEKWAKHKGVRYEQSRESLLYANPRQTANRKYVLGLYEEHLYGDASHFSEIVGAQPTILALARRQGPVELYRLLELAEAKHPLSIARMAVLDLLRAGKLDARLGKEAFDPETKIRLP